MNHSRFSLTATLGIMAYALSFPASANAGRTVHRVHTTTTTVTTTTTPVTVTNIIVYVSQPRPAVVHHVQRVPVYYPVVYRERPMFYPVRVRHQAYYQPSFRPLLYPRSSSFIGYGGRHHGMAKMRHHPHHGRRH